MSLALLAAMKRFTGKPITLPNNPAVMLPKFPLGTHTTSWSALPSFFIWA
jgi:hypothetical protein